MCVQMYVCLCVCVCESVYSYLSLSIVHSSPPRQASISMYRYLLSLNDRYNL